MMPTRATYNIVDVNDGIVWVEDLDGPVSVTNDAENVVKDIAELFPNHRIIYRDTDGEWDELLHDNGVFKGYRLFDRDRDFQWKEKA